MTVNANKPTIWIELTPEQTAQVRRVTGKEVSALELSAEELEERVAPRCIVIYKDQATPK